MNAVYMISFMGIFFIGVFVGVILKASIRSGQPEEKKPKTSRKEIAARKRAIGMLDEAIRMKKEEHMALVRENIALKNQNKDIQRLKDG